jgi:hypothetical protein
VVNCLTKYCPWTPTHSASVRKKLRSGEHVVANQVVVHRDARDRRDLERPPLRNALRGTTTMSCQESVVVGRCAFGR